MGIASDKKSIRALSKLGREGCAQMGVISSIKNKYLVRINKGFIRSTYFSIQGGWISKLNPATRTMDRYKANILKDLFLSNLSIGYHPSLLLDY